MKLQPCSCRYSHVPSIHQICCRSARADHLGTFLFRKLKTFHLILAMEVYHSTVFSSGYCPANISYAPPQHLGLVTAEHLSLAGKTKKVCRRWFTVGGHGFRDM